MPVDPFTDANAAACDKIADGLRRNLAQEMPIAERQVATKAEDAAGTPSLRLASRRCTTQICATLPKNQGVQRAGPELRTYSLACTTYVLLGIRMRIPAL